VTTARLGSGLQGAFLLACGRPAGLALIAAPPAEEHAVAARSFWAMAVSAPAFLCLHLIDWAGGAVPPDAAWSLTQDAFGAVVGWLGFAALSHWIAGRIGRAEQWPRFITAWNWCNVVQYLMLVVAGLPALFGLPALLVETVWLVALGWALWLEWYATYLALAVSARVAVALVGLDFALGLLLLVLTGSAS
jgi:hypothetical protein